MATTISLTIQPADLSRIVHALCKQFNLTETNANAKQALLTYIITVVRAVELQDAQQTAMANQTQVADVQPS